MGIPACYDCIRVQYVYMFCVRLLHRDDIRVLYVITYIICSVFVFYVYITFVCNTYIIIFVFVFYVEMTFVIFTNTLCYTGISGSIVISSSDSTSCDAMSQSIPCCDQ